MNELNLSGTEPAAKRDAAALAQLIVQAGEGLPLLVWEDMREEGQNVMTVGAARAAREEGGFSYRNADIVRKDGQVLSALVSYPLESVSSPEEIEETPPVFRPLLVLENQATPSFYVNVLATFPEAQGQGLATSLLKNAELKAKQAGYSRLSLITGDTNPARRLYERFGFERVGSAKIVTNDRWSIEGKEWLLYIKELD